MGVLAGGIGGTDAYKGNDVGILNEALCRQGMNGGGERRRRGGKKKRKTSYVCQYAGVGQSSLCKSVRKGGEVRLLSSIAIPLCIQREKVQRADNRPHGQGEMLQTVTSTAPQRKRSLLFPQSESKEYIHCGASNDELDGSSAVKRMQQLSDEQRNPPSKRDYGHGTC
jgi:hypothetical protein